MSQKVREKANSEGGEEGDEEITIYVVINGKRKSRRVKRGSKVKDVLKKLKHEETTGLVYRIHDKILKTGSDGKLLENPELEENAVLVIQQAFTGGRQ